MVVLFELNFTLYTKTCFGGDSTNIETNNASLKFPSCFMDIRRVGSLFWTYNIPQPFKRIVPAWLQGSLGVLCRHGVAAPGHPSVL